MTTTATLAFTVERTNQSAAALKSAMMAVVPPLDMLIGLGIWISSDVFTTTVLPNGNPAGVRTLILTLDNTTPAQLSLTADGNSGVIAANVVVPGSQYGGQPIVTYDLCFFPQYQADAAAEGPTFFLITPPAGANEETAKSRPLFRTLMEIDSIVVPQGGANYSAPVIALAGNTMAGGTPATATATVAGGIITAITVTNPGSGYCTPPKVVIADTTGSGAYAMTTMRVESITVTHKGNVVSEAMAALGDAIPPALFTGGLAPTAAAQAAALKNLMGANIQAALRVPVVAAAPVIS